MDLGVVCARRHHPAPSGPIGVDEFAARFVDAFVGVRAEVITLRLEQVRGQPAAAIGVVEIERGAERGRRDAFFRGGRDDVAPGALAFFDRGAEKVVEQQVVQLRIFVERFLDAIEEDRAATEKN